MSQDTILKYFGVLVVVAGVVGTAYVTVDRQAALASELEDQSESIDELEELFNLLRENDIRTEGQLKLEVQRLNSNIANQSAKIDQLIDLFREDLRRRE